MTEQPGETGEINPHSTPAPLPEGLPADTNPGKQSEKLITRRNFVIGGALTTLAVALGKLGADWLVPPPKPRQTENQGQPSLSPTDKLRSPEILKSQIEFGFNTHVHAVKTSEKDNMTLDAFKGDVDRLVAANQKWIRFNFINNGVVQKNPDGSVGFSDKTKVFDDAITYAKERGLKIALVTNAPESFASLPIDQYTKSAADFYSELAKRYKGKIDTWQIFNEADTHHFRDYHDIPAGFEASYLDDLAKVVAASTSAIKSQDQQAKITMNASLWAPDRSIIRGRTVKFFDPLAKYLDIISLDPYPDVYDSNSAQTIPQDIEYFYDKFKKDIVIAEIGI